MRILLFCLMTIFCLTATAQKKRVKFDTFPSLDTAKMNADMRALDSMTNASFKRMQDEQFELDKENMSRNLNSFVAMQNENQKKRLKQNYIRLGIGVLFLIVLIVGWFKKRKVQNK